MNGVIGMTDLLLETDLNARQRDYAQTVRNSGEALLTIINDILDFSKIEAGKLEIEDIEFAVRAIVDDVVDLLAGPAQVKGLELVAVTDGSVPALVTGDPGRVRQVLTNLIGNAIKFTHAGEVVVRVTAEEFAGADGVLRFEVSDTGDGIAQAKLALIFDPFVQADTSTSRRYGGTGLGLAISGQLIALMGGDCGVSSRLGVGSTFWFTIRVHADPAQARHDMAAPHPGLAGVAVLIVDDRAIVRDVLCDYLTEWGMAPRTADSGPAALATLRTAAIQERPFALALVDRSMPGMDGLQLTNAILVDPALSARVVLMTALGQEGDADGNEASGVCGSVSKPVHRADLRSCLMVALGLQPASAGHDVMTPSSSPSTQAQTGRLLLAEDNVINQKVAIAMLSSVGYEIDTVLDGAAAVQAAASHAYDAILMDCQMPELSGYEATAAIRAREGSGRHTPIIAMTAGARHEDRERCLAAGMDGYLAKPVSKDALLALVARLVKNGPTTDPLPLDDRAGAADVAIDRALLDQLLVLEETAEQGFVADLVGQFVLDTEPLLVQLREAVDVGDTLCVSRIAHAIKGSGSQLGGRRLALSCGRLETRATAGVLTDGQTELREVEIDFEDLRRSLTEWVSPPDRRRHDEPSGKPPSEWERAATVARGRRNEAVGFASTTLGTDPLTRESHR
jgi:CheY-like chemotaxis protein/HPt (histidine-containing phosphotransfer) domain-containing protein